MTTRSRTGSRVVPGMSVTIAVSVHASRLSRLDFPTFGAPAITSLTPLRSTAPRWESARVAATLSRSAARCAAVSGIPRRSSSSSGKSIDASMNERNSMSASRWPSMVRENSPESDRRAHRTADADAPSMRSAIASACARSMRSLRKARNVNSPALAGRAPSSQTRSSTMRETTTPPWPCSSRTSSPVNDPGASNRSARPSSITPPDPSLNRT